ncbi:MAG: class I tRNA ligase family protein, partial [Sphingomicrobium sp.]
FHLNLNLEGAAQRYDFNMYVRLLVDFCNNDLSAFYFDVRKDILYCDVHALTGAQSNSRKAYRTVLDIVFRSLVRWCAPVLVFTAEEVWVCRYPDGGSVHLAEWPEIEGPWHDPAISQMMQPYLLARSEIIEAIEPLRRDKVVRSSLEAAVVYPWANLQANFETATTMDLALLADLAIVSKVTPGDVLSVTKSDNKKCGRCWRYLPEVTGDGALCARCEGVLNG